MPAGENEISGWGERVPPLPAREFVVAEIDPEAELRKMLEDDELRAHLRLGVINRLIELRGGREPRDGNGTGHVVMPERADGLPPIRS